MVMPTITINPQKLRSFIQTTVHQELVQILDDPDFGLELRPSVIKRLKQSIKSEKAGRLTDIKNLISELKLGA